MTILRRRPRCHYCGKMSGPIGGTRFRCQICLADNFLDENGEIADVPPEVASSAHYAVPLGQLSSIKPIFCSICLKNQNLHADALAQFLPDPDDPEYDRFESALPEFKRRLEEQYPQCCRQCEPKVKAQLQQATYNARSDHLRRMLTVSRSGRISNVWGWRSLIVRGAGLGYVVSLSIQLLWHTIGSQSLEPTILDLRPTDCLTHWPIPSQCLNLVEQSLGMSLLLAVLVAWWNPKWQHKIKGRHGRLVGLADFYKAQTLVLVLRFSAWIVLRDVPGLEHYRPMLHSFFLVLIILIAGYTNFGLIKVDTTPLIDWHQALTPLLTTNQFEMPAQSESPSRFLPVTDFRSTQQQLEPWRVPVLTSNDDDSMDWSPSPAAFAPQPKQISYKTTQKSPFVGTLPAMPRQGVYSSNIQEPLESTKAIGIPIGFFDRAVKERRTTEDAQASFPQPKFFPNDGRADTGLENIFGKVFSLEDAAIEVREKSTTSSNVKSGQIGQLVRPMTSAGSILFQATSRNFVIALQSGVAVYIMISNYTGSMELSTISTIIFAIVAVSVVEVSFRIIHGNHMSSTGAVLLPIGYTGLLALAVFRPTSQSILSPLWIKLVIGIFCFILMSEVTNMFANSDVPLDIEPILEKDMIVDAARETDPLESDKEAYAMTPKVRPRRESVESVGSVDSIQSTSTTSGWKTPVMNHREHLNIPRIMRSSGLGMGSLHLEDSSVGGTVAGPRSRAAPGDRGSRQRW